MFRLVLRPNFHDQLCCKQLFGEQLLHIEESIDFGFVLPWLTSSMDLTTASSPYGSLALNSFTSSPVYTEPGT